MLPHSVTLPTFGVLSLLSLGLSFMPALAAERAGADRFTSTSIEVSAGQWKTVRLQNLPQHTMISLALTTDGSLTVGFLDGKDHQGFPRVARPLFWGQTESKLGFSVTIQEKGDYYVVLDNREGNRPRHVALTARATLTEAAAQALMAEQLRKVELQLKTLEQKLNQTFVFDPIPIRVKACDGPEPFERAESLTLCLQYARQLIQTFQDQTEVSDALIYSMFQEMARLFQSQWDLESSDPAAPPDELTTVLMLTFRLDANIRAYSQTIINRPALSASLSDVFKDPNHPLTIERAHRVLKWATDPALVRNWQLQLVPHMQTRMLQHLKDHPQPWSDLSLIEQELAARKQPVPQDRPLIRPKGKIKV